MAEHLYDISVHGDNDRIGDFIDCSSYKEGYAKAKELSQRAEYKGIPVANVQLNRYSDSGYGETYNDTTWTFVRGKMVDKFNWGYN